MWPKFIRKRVGRRAANASHEFGVLEFGRKVDTDVLNFSIVRERFPVLCVCDIGAAGRLVELEFFLELIWKIVVRYLLLGHHREDQCEVMWKK